MNRICRQRQHGLSYTVGFILWSSFPGCEAGCRNLCTCNLEKEQSTDKWQMVGARLLTVEWEVTDKQGESLCLHNHGPGLPGRMTWGVDCPGKMHRSSPWKGLADIGTYIPSFHSILAASTSLHDLLVAAFFRYCNPWADKGV